MLINLNEPGPDAGLRVAEKAVSALLSKLATDPLDDTAAEIIQRGLGKPVAALVPHVERLKGFDADARTALQKAFVTDVAFSDQLDRDGPYAFAFEGLDDALRDAAGKLLVAMYEVVFRGGGFPLADGAKLDPDAFEKCFFDANKELAVCPACMRQPLEPSLGGGGGAKPYDIEHFFPKSAYPVLAVHHHNLVPTCITCNQRMHRTTDPLGDGMRESISTTYVPYRRAAQAELIVRFEPLHQDPNQRVRLRGASDAAERRIQTHDRMYKVSARWGAYLEYVHTRVCRSVTRRAPGLQRQAVVEALRERAETTRDDILFTTDALLEAEYCDWLATEGLDTLLTELRRG
jgi:hypothetical protein